METLSEGSETECMWGLLDNLLLAQQGSYGLKAL